MGNNTNSEISRHVGASAQLRMWAGKPIQLTDEELIEVYRKNNPEKAEFLLNTGLSQARICELIIHNNVDFFITTYEAMREMVQSEISKSGRSSK